MGEGMFQKWTGKKMLGILLQNKSLGSTRNKIHKMQVEPMQEHCRFSTYALMAKCEVKTAE